MFYIWMSIVYYLKTEISESKLDSPILNSEQDIEIYNFIQMDHSRGESEVTCIIKYIDLFFPLPSSIIEPKITRAY